MRLGIGIYGADTKFRVKVKSKVARSPRKESDKIKIVAYKSYVQRGRMVVGHTEGGHNATQDDHQRHDAGHAEALQFERVSLIKTLQLVIFEAQLVPRSSSGRPHCVIHGR